MAFFSTSLVVAHLLVDSKGPFQRVANLSVPCTFKFAIARSVLCSLTLNRMPLLVAHCVALMLLLATYRLPRTHTAIALLHSLSFCLCVSPSPSLDGLPINLQATLIGYLSHTFGCRLSLTRNAISTWWLNPFWRFFSMAGGLLSAIQSRVLERRELLGEGFLPGWLKTGHDRLS